MQINPITDGAEPNYWLSALIIDPDAMCKQTRGDTEACYRPEHGKTYPTEILEVLSGLHAEGRPIWKPMFQQLMYRMNEFITRNGTGRARTNAYIEGGVKNAGADIYARGVSLSSNNEMTPAAKMENSRWNGE